MTLIYIKQVCLQLPATADNVALPASTAERRAAARLLLTAGRAAVARYLLAAGPAAANPRNSGVRRPDGRNGQTDGQADGQTDRRTDGRPTDA